MGAEEVVRNGNNVLLVMFILNVETGDLLRTGCGVSDEVRGQE